MTIKDIIKLLPAKWSTEFTYPSEPDEYIKGQVDGANKMLDDVTSALSKIFEGGQNEKQS